MYQFEFLASRLSRAEAFKENRRALHTESIADLCIAPTDCSLKSLTVPNNANLGNCDKEIGLKSGHACQPACAEGYAPSGRVTCQSGVLTSSFNCYTKLKTCLRQSCQCSCGGKELPRVHVAENTKECDCQTLFPVICRGTALCLDLKGGLPCVQGSYPAPECKGTLQENIPWLLIAVVAFFSCFMLAIVAWTRVRQKKSTTAIVRQNFTDYHELSVDKMSDSFYLQSVCSSDSDFRTRGSSVLEMINNHFTPSVNELNDVDLGEHEEEDSGYEYIRM